MEKYPDKPKGRGASLNPANQFAGQQYDNSSLDGLDEPLAPGQETQLLQEHAKKILNPVKSPDIPCEYSMNPYQGCEHGCVYCYARNAHEYWGYSAGLDFERKIIVKQNAAALLEAAFMKKSWRPTPIMFSGNTDCYQPAERELQLTRACLEVFWKFRHPVSLITKNSLILRDLDVLEKLASEDLVHVYISITSEDESLRRKMEPRTATTTKRFETVRQLTGAGVPTGVMIAPIIPGLNNHEIPALMARAAAAGAIKAGFTMVRLNGAVADIFEAWLREAFPDRAEKVLNQIRSTHGGQLGDSRFGRRMRGEGKIATAITDLFKLSRRRHFGDAKLPPYNLNAFRRPGEQMSLFGE